MSGRAQMRARVSDSDAQALETQRIAQMCDRENSQAFAHHTADGRLIDPIGSIVAAILEPPAVREQRCQAEGVQRFTGNMTYRGVLYVRADKEGKPALADLVRDSGQGEPPELKQVPADSFLFRDAPYTLSIGERIRSCLRRWGLPPEVTLMLIRKPR